jgi:ubiquitin C-terminal hydrolase
MHQDAHEFLNYTLNTIAEDVQKYQKRIAEEKETKQSSIHSEASQTDTNTSTGNGEDDWFFFFLYGENTH